MASPVVHRGRSSWGLRGRSACYGPAELKDALANTLGIRRIMFAVEDIEDVVARLRTHGAELVGELAQ